MAELAERGYQGPRGNFLVKRDDKGSLNVSKGVFPIGRTAITISMAADILKELVVILGDPGVCQPLTTALSPLFNPRDEGEGFSDFDLTFNVTRDIFDAPSSAWSILGAYEKRRCKRNKAYGAALDVLRQMKKRTCLPGGYATYCEVEHQYIDLLADERYAGKAALERRRQHWKAFTGKQQAIDLLADDLFGLSSTKPWKLRRREPNRKKRAKLKKRLLQRKRVLKGRIAAFIFGNGSWSYRRWGYKCLPRKPLVRALPRRGLVLILDEYHTSKLCPGCGKELIDVGKKVDPKTGLQSRLRQCVTVRREKGCCPLFRPNE